MQILLIHNNYGIYTGEEAVVDKQISLFKEMGHTVRIYRKTTEGVRNTVIGDVKGFLQGFYSYSSIKDIKRIIKSEKPDIVIVHNLYPYISPAVLKPISEAGIPIVMTVHNFRLICPTGLFMRNSKPCELCLEKGNEWPSIRYNCENSYPRSIGYAGRNWYARISKAYKNHVDYYACITQFQIQKLIEAGFDKNKMIHIPNFLEIESEPKYILGDYIAVSGRVSREKGVDLILEVARRTPHIEYRFAGEIRKEDPVIDRIPENCHFLGNLSREEMKNFYQKSRFLLSASRCYEGFPLTLLEAASYGKMAIAPAHAGFLEIIKDGETGLHFCPGDMDSLQSVILNAWDDADSVLSMGEKAYLYLKQNYVNSVVKNYWAELFSNIKESFSKKCL